MANKMRGMLLAALAALMAGAAEVAVPAEASWRDWVRASTELNLYSAYVWRGQILFDRPCWQPAQNFFWNLGPNAEYGAIRNRIWANCAINGNKRPHRFGGMSIVDETISYVKSFDNGLDVESGFILYQFPNRHAAGLRETDEFLAGVRWRNPYLTPKVYVWWDFDSNGHNPENMLYFDFDLSHAFALTDKLTLLAGSGCGLANGPYMDHYTRGNMDDAAFNNFHSDLTLTYAITSWLKVGGSLTYWYSLSHPVRHSNYDMDDSYNAGILRGGVHLAANW